MRPSSFAALQHWPYYRKETGGSQCPNCRLCVTTIRAVILVTYGAGMRKRSYPWRLDASITRHEQTHTSRNRESVDDRSDEVVSNEMAPRKEECAEGCRSGQCGARQVES